MTTVVNIRIMYRTVISLVLLLTLIPASGWAWYPRAPDEQRLKRKDTAQVVGNNRYYHVAEGETLIQLARAFGLGFSNLAQANPDIDPWLPQPGRSIVLPYATVLPKNLRHGITINLADFKLYLVQTRGGIKRVRIYPVGIGVEGWETPLGRFRVRSKARKPVWSVPASIRAEDPSLPRYVKPGPDNPLGDYWMAFTRQQHGIHGTNEPYGVGRRVSHGCIRLFPEDIKDLYRRVRIGTPVYVIYEPIKLGRSRGQLFLEVHPDYRGTGPEISEFIEERCRELKCKSKTDPDQIRFAGENRLGYPLKISTIELSVANTARP